MKLRTVIIANSIAALLSISFLMWLWPDLVHRFGFEWILLNWPLSILIGTVIFFGMKNFSFSEISSRLTVIFGSISVVTASAGGAFIVARDYGTYLQYAKFTVRETHVVTDPAFVRFTPLRVAFRNMFDTVNDAAETIDPELTNPIFFENGFGYAAQITPEGIVPTFTNNISSVMVFEDRPGIKNDEERRRRVNQSFDVGPHMQWFDNLQRKLVLNDFFASYEEPHLLAWNKDGVEEFTMAIPKVKYSWFLFPYWAGVTIVHSDGSLSDFTPEEIMSEENLKGQWLFPANLALRYVNLQNFGTSAGVFGPYFQVSGKLEIYKMPEIEPDANSSASHMATNQFPFLTKGLDGNVYHVVMTKAEGGGSGVYRAYYINASTGIGTYLQYEPGQVEYGPIASLDRVKKVPGYNWRRETGKSVSGNIVVAEPIYIVRENDPILYWKGSILATNFAAISATVVAPASHPEDFILFRTRESFESWLSGGNLEEFSDVTITLKIQELIDLLNQAVLDAEGVNEELAKVFSQ